MNCENCGQSEALKTVFKVWCEYELGQDDVVFSSEEKAYEWLEERLPYYGLEESVDELLEEDNCGIDEVDFI